MQLLLPTGVAAQVREKRPARAAAPEPLPRVSDDSGQECYLPGTQPLDYRPQDAGKLVPAGTDILHADLLSREAVVEAARGADVVVHAANVPYPEWPRLVPALAENALAAAEAA